MIKFDNLQAALEEYGNVIAEQYKSNLKANGHKATGNLINSITSHITVNGYEYAIELNLADYWYYVENGRGPTQTTAPSQPTLREKILEWIKVKKIPTTGMNPKLPEEKKLEQLAFLITRKIHTEGFEGSNDLEKAIDITINEWDEKITDALDKDVMNCIDEILLMA